jgi:hypothetical protein
MSERARRNESGAYTFCATTAWYRVRISTLRREAACAVGKPNPLAVRATKVERQELVPSRYNFCEAIIGLNVIAIRQYGTIVAVHITVCPAGGYN